MTPEDEQMNPEDSLIRPEEFPMRECIIFCVRREII
jgi:hypothetical protein